MQGQGAGISGLTMVSAQRWGTGEGSRGSPFSLRRKMSITEPRPHSPASRWFPEAASGPERRIPGCKEVLRLVRGREEALTTTGAPVGGGRAEAHTAPGESSARSPVPRIPAPPPPRRTHLLREEVSGRAARRRHRVPAWLEGLRAV